MHPNLIDDLFQREQEVIKMQKNFQVELIINFFFHKNNYSYKFIERNKFTKNAITKLDLKKSLREHEGCVNCLEWSSKNFKFIKIN